MKLLQQLGVSHPVIQAPMAGTSTPAMAAAVSNAGALGFLGLGSSNAESAVAQIAETKRMTNRAFGLNFFCHAPPPPDPTRDKAWIEYLRPEFAKFGAEPPATLTEIYMSFVADEAMFELVLRERPAVVSYHFGLPSADKIAAIKKAGIIQMATATCLTEAKRIRDAGLDAIVAQGYEAGGHRGVFDPAAEDSRLGMFSLVQVLVCAMDIPVIAAGGIMDGAGIAAVLKIGAVAAQLGTAFIGCPESAADEGFRKALASDAAHHTTITAAVSGRPARCLANKFTLLDDRNAAAYPRAYDAGKALNAAAKAKGETGYGAQWAGQSAPLARSMPAAELVATLVREME